MSDIKRRELKTEQGIERVIDVKYKFTKDVSEFNRALHYLDNLKKYHSVIAEKRRNYILKKKINLILNPKEINLLDEDGNHLDVFKIEAEKKFENLFKSYLNFVNPMYLEEDYDVINYFQTKSTGNIVEKNKFEKNKKVQFKYIVDDVIYIDEFELKYDNLKAKILVKKSIKTPFPLENFSYKSLMAKWNFKRKFKYYINDIEHGLIK